MNFYRHLSVCGIIGLAAIVFAYELVGRTSLAPGWGTIPTHARAAFNGLLAGELTRESIQTFATLVTSMFLHGSPEHILFNMVFLWTFGVLTSDLLGQWRMLAIFILCGIGGAIVHTVLNPDSSAPMVGASGAICGLEGIYLGLALRWQLPFADVWPLAHPVPPMQLGAFAVIGFVGDMVLLATHDEQIAYGAHLGGLLTGITIAAAITTIYPTISGYNRASRKARF
ncbi:MAG: rhomboid family intramembrane serine protease [Planctomycetes bacterium]|nr:rhomboid family intramembrane serine protease [Planctomycetota bacterium]